MCLCGVCGRGEAGQVGRKVSGEGIEDGGEGRVGLGERHGKVVWGVVRDAESCVGFS